jgi:peptidoglycan hydrolase CwlO-like protein
MPREKQKSLLSDWKKPLRILALVIALVGSFILMIFTFLIHDALDKTEQSMIRNVDGIQATLVDVENTLTGVENELDAAENTVGKLDNSLEPLSEGLNSTADALAEVSDSLALVSIPGIGINIDTGKLDEAADSLTEASEGLEATGFDEHKENILDLKGALAQIKDDITAQRIQLGDTKRTIEEVIGLMKIANVLFFLVVVSMFFMLSLNSVAGML